MPYVVPYATVYSQRQEKEEKQRRAERAGRKACEVAEDHTVSRPPQKEKGQAKIIQYQGPPQGQVNIILYQGPPQRQVRIVPYQGPPQQVHAQAHGQAAAPLEAQHQVQAQAQAPPPSRSPKAPFGPTLTTLMAEQPMGIASSPASAHPAQSRLSGYRPVDQQRPRQFRG